MTEELKIIQNTVDEKVEHAKESFKKDILAVKTDKETISPGIGSNKV